MKKNKYVTTLYLLSLLLACNGLWSCTKRVDLLSASKEEKLSIADRLVANGSIEPSELGDNNLAILARQVLVPDLELSTEELVPRVVLIELIHRRVNSNIDRCNKKPYFLRLFKPKKFLKIRSFLYHSK